MVLFIYVACFTEREIERKFAVLQPDGQGFVERSQRTKKEC